MAALLPARWRPALEVYLDRRIMVVLVMGFASGLPLLLTLSTLSIWLTEEGVSLTSIGLFALVGVPYSFKFLWAPLIDRAPIPALTGLLGRRRSWLLVIQAALIGAIVCLGASSPAAMPFWAAFWAVLVSFLSASQDIVIDAYRIEILDEKQQGAGAAVTQFGYRIGLLASGAGALFLADHASWFVVYAVMAALLLIGVATTVLCVEPRSAPPVSVAPRRGFGAVMQDAVIGPFQEFIRRSGLGPALIVLAFILLYKFGDAFAGVMANPFYIQIGFTKTEIASVSKVFGLAATLLGVFLGGLAVGRYGVIPALLACGVLQMGSNLMFAVQAAAGADVTLLFATIGIENLSGGMGSAAFVAYLSMLCNVTYTATQYALFSSFMAFGRTLLSSSSGWVADNVDWVTFFVISTLVAIPGLVMLLWMMKRFPTAGRAQSPVAALAAD